ncbi:hypothetical protein HPB51_028384 [Rhipicephalus microplus]|uniref:Uncharacterized protein n=1 Tax=Rhipicephalus microplus TaxID=6941 RepID=A0A9J6CX64_RHIMP|nr:hypothetical protein HPB51_028384 [Rhipicephalus microplus]
MPCLSFAQTLLSCPDVAEIRVNYRHNIVALNVTIRECLKMLVAISVLQCIPLIAKEPEDHRTSTGYCMASTETQRRRPCCLAFCSQCLCCWPPGRAARTPYSSETLFPQNMRRCSVCTSLYDRPGPNHSSVGSVASFAMSRNAAAGLKAAIRCGRTHPRVRDFPKTRPRCVN